MIVHVFDEAGDAAIGVARRIADAIAENPALVLGLAAGRSPIAAYDELVRLHRAGTLDWSRVRTFNLDEFVGLAPNEAGSFRQAMQVQLFGRVNLPPSSIEFLDGTAGDLDAECDRYEGAIERAGGLHLQLLGIGLNGHLAFNEPGTTLRARTHLETLRDETRRENADAFGGDPARVPAAALTMGMGTILSAESLVMLATGRRKASVVARALQGPLTTRVPASFLQTHRRVEVFLDRDAAASLERDSDFGESSG